MTPKQIAIKWIKKLGGPVVFGHQLRELELDIQRACLDTERRAMTRALELVDRFIANYDGQPMEKLSEEMEGIAESIRL